MPMKNPKNVKPIPTGYHSITPYLTIKGAAKAIDFYQQAFGAQVISRMDGPDGKVGHAELRIGDSVFMLGDENIGKGCLSPLSLKGSPTGLYLYVDDADVVFAKAVKAGAKAETPVQDMFWGDRHGAVVDPFGHRWSIATHQEDLTSEQIHQRAKEAFSKASQA